MPNACSLSHRPFRSSRRAFTLIEILVAVMIMGMLAALLYPAFVRAKENGRRTTCQSNLRQIGIALAAYTQDNDGALVRPWYVSNAISDVNNYKWMDAIFPWIKTESVFDCPSSDSQKTKPYTYYKNLSHADAHYGSYLLNASYQAPNDPYTSPADGRVRESQVMVPSGTLWVSEGSPDYELNWYAPSETPDVENTIPRTLPAQDSRLEERHFGMINSLYVDGHVKSLRLDALARTKRLGRQDIITAFTIEDD